MTASAWLYLLSVGAILGIPTVGVFVALYGPRRPR